MVTALAAEGCEVLFNGLGDDREIGAVRGSAGPGGLVTLADDHDDDDSRDQDQRP